MKKRHSDFDQAHLQSSEQHNYSGTNELEDSKVLVNYNADVVKKLSRSLEFFPDRATLRIIEFGAGIGTIAKLWKEKTGIEPELCEIDPNQRSRLREMGFKKVSPTLGKQQSAYDIVYSSNVLEHIENDAEVLGDLFSSLKAGGILALYVPAMPILFSELDERVGHYRRYTRRGLRAAVREAGFTVIRINYSDSVGVPASLAIKMLGWNTSTGIGGARSLTFYDSVLYPLSKFLDSSGLRFLLGKNLLLIARKPLGELTISGNEGEPKTSKRSRIY